MAPLSLQLPPLLLCGPPGTGKTFTLVQATRALLREDSNRVLLCSHTEAAADTLTNDIQALMGHSLPQGWLLRLQGCSRPVKSTAAASHRSSGLAQGTVELQQPGREDVNRSRVVICTVRQTKQLIHLSLDTGCFTHILVEEASSAPECETVMALSLAGRSTRVVLAGDPAQLPPLVYSEFARERGLQRPLLERLSACYPQGSSHMVMLMEQYRSQQHIVRLVSELFYQGELKASSKQPTHKDFFPLSFFTAWGTDKSSCGYLNYAEVLEVVEQVEDLCKKWPVSWGKLEEGSVGVLTPYPQQAMCLRAELRRRNLGCATVQTLVSLPRRYFRAVFLSTVRTRHTLKQRVLGGARRREPSLEEEESIEDRELGFLSSPRTLRSVLLCAQSLLAVVGDPVALCTVGKCRRIWERFLSACDSEGSLHGTTLAYVLEQVDMVESRGCDVLNPMAPEFVPRGPSRLALTNRLTASLPHITVKRSSSLHFKQPFQREHYGPLGTGVPQSAPPYLLALSPGRPCVYRRSPGPPPRLRPLSRASLLCDLYRSRLLLLGRLPFSCPTYANRVPVDPRTVACQAAVACNFHLLQKPASPPLAGPSPHLHHSPPQSYRTPPDCRLHHVTAGRGDIGAGFGATCLRTEAEGEEQFSGACGFRHSRSSGPSRLEQCCPSTLPVSQPYSSSTSPQLGCDPSHSSIRMSPELGCLNYYGPLTRSLCQSSKLQNGGHGSARAGDEERSRYSPWAEQISPPFSPLLHRTVTSPRLPRDIPLLSPTTRPACSPGYRTENNWGCMGSSTSAPPFQLLPQEQQHQGGTELYSSPRPGAAERTESDWMGGRRLYQRSPSPQWSAEESPLSQTDPPCSPYVCGMRSESTSTARRRFI
ncbi:hypothetical protein GJAV_G00262470 [Gymnothorax javanicus]|nr:hypothetical protein GJAV_G00262470 [Gymnothorax javanicus]